MKSLNLLCMLSSYRKCTMKMDRFISQIGERGLHTVLITQYNLTTICHFLFHIESINVLFISK